MKAKTICALVLAIGLGACGEPTNAQKCPYPSMRVQIPQKYKIEDYEKYLKKAVDEYNTKHKGVKVDWKFESKELVMFDIKIHDTSACYPGMSDDIANLSIPPKSIK